MFSYFYIKTWLLIYGFSILCLILKFLMNIRIFYLCMNQSVMKNCSLSQFKSINTSKYIDHCCYFIIYQNKHKWFYDSSRAWLQKLFIESYNANIITDLILVCVWFQCYKSAISKHSIIHKSDHKSVFKMDPFMHINPILSLLLFQDCIFIYDTF